MRDVTCEILERDQRIGKKIEEQEARLAADKERARLRQFQSSSSTSDESSSSVSSTTEESSTQTPTTPSTKNISNSQSYEERIRAAVDRAIAEEKTKIALEEGDPKN